MGLEREQLLAEAVRDLLESYELLCADLSNSSIVVDAAAAAGCFDRSIADAKAALQYKEPSYVSRPDFCKDATTG
jgi:hypothetical protein